MDAYTHGRVKISSLLNTSVQELGDLTPIMIQTIFFCNVKNFLLSDELFQKISPYFFKK
jgi:hypothetical protein